MERFDLGNHSWQISTQSTDAQRLFNLGLNWCYGFNQEEGVACFKRALQHDPECAMLHWGIAYGAGPFYNLPWCDMSHQEASHTTNTCYEHSRLAQALAGHGTDLERALIDALATRYPQPHAASQEEYNGWDNAYADAMRSVYKLWPDQQDVMALLVEALITRTPWKLWNLRTGKPLPGADTLEALDVCERAIEQADTAGQMQHPAILHLHIHVLEMSSEPERAMRSAETLGSLSPDAGHLNHMPCHILALCGHYEQSRLASERAIRADNLYVDYAGPYNFYTSARCHDLHMMMHTCMLLGQYQPAIQSAEQMCATLSKDVLAVKEQPFLAMTMEGYYSMKMHVLVRFGKWQEIIGAPMPDDPELYCVTVAMHHYAKGIAFATLKDIGAAEQQKTWFLESLKRISKERKFFNNRALTTLGIAHAMLQGELEYHKGNYQTAFNWLRVSVNLDDALEYTEPWAWMHPPRHALAALLMEQGEYIEAEEVYRTDLGLNDTLQRCSQHPRNVWALHGLVECLTQRQARDDLEKFQPLLDDALSLTDIAITSSCLCRGHAGT